MNTYKVKCAPPAATDKGTKNTNNRSYCITIQEDCKALKSFLEQEHIFKIVWDEYMENYERTEETTKADQYFEEILRQIKDKHLFDELDEANGACGAAYEFKGFYNGFRCALDFIFRSKTDEN